MRSGVERLDVVGRVGQQAARADEQPAVLAVALEPEDQRAAPRRRRLPAARPTAVVDRRLRGQQRRVGAGDDVAVASCTRAISLRQQLRRSLRPSDRCGRSGRERRHPAARQQRQDRRRRRSARRRRRSGTTAGRRAETRTSALRCCGARARTAPCGRPSTRRRCRPACRSRAGRRRPTRSRSAGPG